MGRIIYSTRQWLTAALLAVAIAACLPTCLCAQSAGAGGSAVNSTAHPMQADTPTVDAAAIPTRSLLQVLHDGGPLIIPIAVCSFILLMFVFERFISLRRGRVIPRPFVRRFLEQIREGQLDQEEAIALCEKNDSPVAKVFAAGVRKWGRPSVEVEQAILDSGERVANTLRKYLRVLNGVSTVSPLLGLLGTVLGMIHAFNAIATADAMGRPETLAGGISQALLTTAAGLSVAIPALIAFLYFSGRVDQLVMELDSLGQRLVDLISADAPAIYSSGERRGKDQSERRRRAA